MQARHKKYLVRIITFFSLFLLDFALATTLELQKNNTISICKEILKAPSERKFHFLKDNIFIQGDLLLNDFFGHDQFTQLTRSEIGHFIEKKELQIIENLSNQETLIEHTSSPSSFVVKGGMSRLGRTAFALKKSNISVVIDLKRMQKIDSLGEYVPAERIIYLGLEDALYPNQLSLNLQHEAMHSSFNKKTLFIPFITSRVGEFRSSLYEGFALDELIIQLQNLRVIKNKNLTNQIKSRIKETDIIFIIQELAPRILLKKKELLKVAQTMLQLQKNPEILISSKILESKEKAYMFENLDPDIALIKGDDLHSNQNIDSIVQKAKASRNLILKALELSQNICFNFKK